MFWSPIVISFDSTIIGDQNKLLVIKTFNNCVISKADVWATKFKWDTYLWWTDWSHSFGENTKWKTLSSHTSDAVSKWAGWALVHLEFGNSVKPLLTRGGGRLCPPHYCPDFLTASLYTLSEHFNQSNGLWSQSIK